MLNPFVRQFLWLAVSLLLAWAAFPPLNFWPLAWIALVPLLLELSTASLRGAFGRGYLFGYLYFLCTLWWIGYVTVPGMLLLVAYLALYWGLWAMAAVYVRRFSPAVRIYFLPAVYVLLEYVRENFLSGFGWASLGHSQSGALALIQVAGITGAAGVSYLVVMGNVCLAEWLRDRNSAPRSLVGPLVIVAVVVGCGGLSLARPFSGARISVALVQGNISLAESWNPSGKQAIVARYLDLSRGVLNQGPQLIVWPETAFPPFIQDEPELYARVKDLSRQAGIPILFGAVMQRDGKYFNSALLVRKDQEKSAVYSKRHLVVFGEYIPWRRQLPFLAAIAPIDDFTPGTAAVSYTLPAGGRFAPLVCFEDTLPGLAREAAAGNELLVNITNDAWFRDSPGPRMHLDNAVFRAVENRRSIVQAANTGLSCLVDPAGRVGPCAGHNGRNMLRAAAAVVSAPLVTEQTFYTKYGDVFTFLCFIGIIGVVLVKRRVRH